MCGSLQRPLQYICWPFSQEGPFSMQTMCCTLYIPHICFESNNWPLLWCRSSLLWGQWFCTVGQVGWPVPLPPSETLSGSQQQPDTCSDHQPSASISYTSHMCAHTVMCWHVSMCHQQQTIRTDMMVLFLSHCCAWTYYGDSAAIAAVTFTVTFWRVVWKATHSRYSLKLVRETISFVDIWSLCNWIFACDATSLSFIWPPTDTCSSNIPLQKTSLNRARSRNLPQVATGNSNKKKQSSECAVYFSHVTIR